jgi:predicted  nucleic acid-binding Zn-ribbon protein
MSEKTTIRLKKVAQRLSKTKYSNNKINSEIIKLHDTCKEFEKSISDCWDMIYKRGFVAGVDNSNPAYFDDFDLIELLQSKLDKKEKSLQRKIEKHQINLSELLQEHKALNVRQNTSF